MTVQSIILSGSLVLLSLACFPAFSADAQTTRREVPAPQTENFTSDTDFLTPWLNSSCPMRNGDYVRDSNCTPEIGPDAYLSHRVELFNADGSLWYQFSVIPREEGSFIKAGSADTPKRSDFIPFKFDSWNNRDAPAQLILRMVGESPFWYEVEINEKTRETKFALKHLNRMWTKVPGSFWLHMSPTLTIDGRRTKLLDSPDGKVKQETGDLELDWVLFIRADGEWAFVERMVGNHTHSGWVRWRDGRRILVGCVLNEKKIAEQ